MKKIQSDVLTLEESELRLESKRFETFVGIVRSGQVVRAAGDILF